MFFVLPPVAFLVQEHLERAIATAELPFDTLAQPAVLAGLALQLPFGVAALVLARVLLCATVAIARRLARRTGRTCDSARSTSHAPTGARAASGARPVRGRGPPAFAVP